MRKKLNKKGFTLVEIIGVVAILGIVSVVGLVSVNSIIQKGKQEHYVAAEKNLKITAESYAQANRDYLPKNVGEMKKVTLRTLVENNYMEPIKDYHDKNCDLDNSYVQIFKYSKNGYSYLAYLDCPDYKNIEANNELVPSISIEMSSNANNIKKTKSKVTITDNNKLLSYTITIYKYDEEVYTTGNIEANFDTNVTKEIDISKYTPGKIKTVVRATNIYGNQKTETKTMTYADKQKPTCIVKTEDKTRGNDDWIKTGNRKITVGCNDGEEGSGCEREEYTQTFKEDMKYGYITIKDKAGNEEQCRVDVFIDRTKPSCTISDTGRKGNSNWYIEPSTITINPVDTMSGIRNRSLQTTATLGTYNQISSSTQYETKGQVWYGFVEDYAGNTANCVSQNVKVDTTAPTAPTGGTITAIGSSKDAELGEVGNSTDQTSGVKEYKYQVIKNSSTKPAYNDANFTTSRAYKRACGTTYYGYAIAEDKAGNKSEVHFIGSTSDGPNQYSAWGECSVACGGGTQTRTNSCALVTTGLSQPCNEMDCCSSIYYQDGASCTAKCGGGTRNRLAYSNYNGQRCEKHDVASGGSACETQSCCSSVYYVDGGTCSPSCGAGSYNRLAYSNYNGQRCSANDQGSGGSYCTNGSCTIDISATKYVGCDSYYITSCTGGTCSYSQKNGSSSSGTVSQSSLSDSKPGDCVKVAKTKCNAKLNSCSGATAYYSVTNDEACAMQSLSTGCSKSKTNNYRFSASFGGVGSSCSFSIKFEGVYIYNGVEHNKISWKTERKETGKYCTDAWCVTC